MKLTSIQLRRAANRFSGSALLEAKAALFQSAATFIEFAEQKKLILNGSVESFDAFQEAVVQYYIFLRRNNAEETVCRNLLKEKMGDYLTLMVCNDFQENGARLMLSRTAKDHRLIVSILPGSSLDLYELAAEAADEEFDYGKKYLSVRFEGLMKRISAMIDAVEETPDEQLFPREPLLE